MDLPELPPFAGDPSLAEPAPRVSEANEAIRELEAWAWGLGWRGSDPYDALNGSRAKLIGRTPFTRRVVIQVARRSPIDLDRLLGVPPGENANTIAHALRAYARIEPELGIGCRERADWAIDRLDALRCPTFDEPCWSYHFDVETRFFFYSAATPNTVATAFAAHALLDAAERLGSERALALARGAGRFFLRRIERTPDPDGSSGHYLGYFPGDRTPIHNASLLAASVLARIASLDGGAEEAEVAAGAVAYATHHQREDGSWPYAEGGKGDWVDTLHTGYVLDALLGCARWLDDEAARLSWHHGMALFRQRLFDRDGAPRFTVARRYPVDGQYVAQAIETFGLGAGDRAELIVDARRVLEFGLASMRRSDGAFVYQRSRRVVNRAPHMRWVEAPMLAALASYVEAEGRAVEVPA